MIFKYIEDLLFHLRERQKLVSERLTSGDFQNFESYKEIVGLLKGLQESETIAKDLYKALTEPYYEKGERISES